jgi:hypothetical protein
MMRAAAIVVAIDDNELGAARIADEQPAQDVFRTAARRDRLMPGPALTKPGGDDIGLPADPLLRLGSNRFRKGF